MNKRSESVGLTDIAVELAQAINPIKLAESLGIHPDPWQADLLLAGDSQYCASSGTVIVGGGCVPIPIKITASNTYPPVGLGITLTVTVFYVPNKKVTVTHTTPDGRSWQDGVFNTGSTGTVTFSSGTYGSVGPRVYTAVFSSEPFGGYMPSSGTVTVNVQPKLTPTPTPTIQVSISGPTKLLPGAGGYWTATVLVNGKALPQSQLDGKIYWFIDGRYHPTNTMTGATINGPVMYSDANGESTTWAPAGAHTLNAEYIGDPSHPNASITVVSS